jgi:hypothetical protein
MLQINQIHLEHSINSFIIYSRHKKYFPLINLIILNIYIFEKHKVTQPLKSTIDVSFTIWVCFVIIEKYVRSRSY